MPRYKLNTRTLSFLRGSNVNRKLFDHALRHGHALEQYKNGQVRKVARLVGNDIIPVLAKELSHKLYTVSVIGGSAIRDSKRLRDVILSTNAIMQEGMEKVGESVIKDMKEFALTEARWQKAVVDTVSPIDLNFVMPNVGTLNNLVVGQPIHGKFIREIFEDISDRAVKNIQQQINIGIVAGESTDKMIQRVIGDQTPTDALYRQSEAVVRTTVTHVSNATRQESFAANADIIEGFQFVATLDDRTTPICIMNDGKIFKLEDGGPTPPLHFNCRSTIIPVMKSFKQLGLEGLNELPSTTRASLGDVFTGQVDGKIKYGDWLRTQSKEFAEEVMGKQRAELFLDNKLSIDKFINDKGKWIDLDTIQRKIDKIAG